MKKRAEVWFESTHTLSSRGRQRTGVGHYTEECVAHLSELDRERNYTVVGNVFAGAKPNFPNPRPKRVRYRLSRWFPGKVWNQLYKKHLMPPLNWMIPGQPDLVVFLNFVRYPVVGGVRTMVAVHDLAFVRFPQAVQRRNMWFLRKFVPRSVKRSTHVIAISESTKRDLMDVYGVPEGKISVVYPGVDLEHFRPVQPTPEQRERFGLPDKYFLFVSTLEPRKNVLGLLRAYRMLPERLRREYAMVLTGGMGWKAGAIMDAIKAGDPVGRIMRTSYVPQPDLPALYGGSTALVLPSLYEGFGMTPVEAMACGVPVICANNSSLPEAVGDAGMLVETDNDQALAEAMERVATDAKVRADMVAKGQRQARKFTWERSAEQLKAAVDKALSV